MRDSLKLRISSVLLDSVLGEGWWSEKILKAYLEGAEHVSFLASIGYSLDEIVLEIRDIVNKTINEGSNHAIFKKTR